MTNRGPNDKKEKALEVEEVQVEEVEKELPQSFEAFTSDVLKIVEDNEQETIKEEPEE